MIFLSLSWNYQKENEKVFIYRVPRLWRSAPRFVANIVLSFEEHCTHISLSFSLSGKKSFLWAWRHVIKGALVRSTRQLIVSRAPWFSSKEFPRIPILSLRSCKIRDRILAYGLSKNRFRYYKSIKIKAKSRNDG